MVLTGHKTPSILLNHCTALKASEVAARLGGGAIFPLWRDQDVLL